MKKLGVVFWGSVSFILFAVLFGLVAPTMFETVTGNIQAFLTTSFGWYYLLVVIIVVVFCVFLILSPVGAIRLGKRTDRPEYSNLSWFAMLFSTGMGIGLVFYGAAEPLSHFAVSAPVAEEGSQTALKDAFRYTFFHWGISAWAIYGIVALALAYFQFRKGLPGLLSSTLYPILGERIHRWPGHLINILAAFATSVGIAATLGTGASQINGGLAYLADIPVSFTVQFIIIIIATFLFIVSASTGLNKGIQILSNVNLYIAFFLLIIVFTIGPTISILNNFMNGMGSYLQNFINMSFRTAPSHVDQREWINSWTIFYWAWWMSWSPFVGVFIARISRGRTIREFLMGVILLPTVLSAIWFSTFGTTGIQASLENSHIASLPTEQVLFGIFEQLPLGTILSVIAILLVLIFFVTSADSATFVLGMQVTGGSLNPPFKVKLIMGILQSSIAASLLYTGGLAAVQNAAIIAAFPFSFIVLLMVYSLYSSLMKEQKELGLYIRPRDKKQINVEREEKDIPKK